MSSRILDQWRQEGRNISALQRRQLSGADIHSLFALQRGVVDSRDVWPLRFRSLDCEASFYSADRKPLEDAQRNSP